VRYTMRREGVVTGADEGYIWLHDGTLFFKGLQSVWRLNRDDMPPVPMWPRRRRPRLQDGKPPTWLPMPHAGPDGDMLLTPIDPYEDNAARRRFATFFASLDDWLRSTPQGHIESLLPPSDLHPSLEGPRGLEAIAAPYLLSVLNQCMILATRLNIHQGQFGSVADGLVATVYFTLFATTSWFALRSRETARVRLALLRQKRVESVLYP
ncbi:MAG: hypothetical protein JSS65_15210, partial [Armatimonadetes bacterium]|nr:hypothetical protein [Armatimonadota bacterium]